MTSLSEPPIGDNRALQDRREREAAAREILAITGENRADEAPVFTRSERDQSQPKFMSYDVLIVLALVFVMPTQPCHRVWQILLIATHGRQIHVLIPDV